MAIAACSAMAPTLAAADQSPSCSLSQVETSPATVIEPCTAIIDNTAAPAENRGYALFIRGKGYHNTKRFKLAGQDYDEAIKLTPKNAELFVSRANIAFRGGNLDEGIVFLQQAVELDPSNAHALRMIGTLAGPDAERYYSMALASDPTEAYALLFRSRLYTARRQFDQALKDADALVAMAPDAINRQGYLDENGDRLDFHAMALENRATIYDKLGNAARAEDDHNTAVAYSHSAQTLSARGQFLAYKKGREKDALPDLDQAIALASTDPYTFHAKGMIHVWRKQYTEAFAAFDAAVKLNPHFGSALQMRARMYREMDQTDLAVADMEHAILSDDEVLQRTMPALRNAGYWTSRDEPTELTPPLQDAIRACMLDKRCN